MIVLAAAFAQGFDVGGDIENYRPSLDATRALATDPSRSPEGWITRAELVYQREPLTYRREDGQRFDVVRDALALHVGGGAGWGRLRIGASAPVYLWVTGEGHAPRTVIGDPTLDVKVTLLAPDPDGFGLALAGGLDVPLGGDRYHLGATSVTGRATVIADVEEGRFYAAINAGAEVSRPQDLTSTRLGSNALLRGVVSVTVHPRWAVSAESFGRIGLLAGAGADLPFEVMGAVHHTPQGGIAPFVAGGFGVSPSIGTPVARAVIGVRVTPARVDGP